MAGTGGGGVSRGGGDSWRRLWETARAGVAVAQGIGSGACAARVCRCTGWAQWFSEYGSSGPGHNKRWQWLKEARQIRARDCWGGKKMK